MSNYHSRMFIKGRSTMFRSQYGQVFWARSLKDLKEQIGTSNSKAERMYVDDNDGNSFHCGYVIRGHWLSAYHPVRIPA